MRKTQNPFFNKRGEHLLVKTKDNKYYITDDGYGIDMCMSRYSIENDMHFIDWDTEKYGMMSDDMLHEIKMQYGYYPDPTEIEIKSYVRYWIHQHERNLLDSNIEKIKEYFELE